MQYERIIFVCQDNTTLSPMAENAFIALYKGPAINVASRGLVVPFSVPYNPKICRILQEEGFGLARELSHPLLEEEVTAGSLLVAMNRGLGLRLHKKYPRARVCTLGILAGVSYELEDPYGKDEEAYRASFQQLCTMMELATLRVARTLLDRDAYMNFQDLFEE